VIHAPAPSDLPRILDLLARANDIAYDITKVAEEKCFGPGFEGEPQVRVFGNYEGMSVSCGKYLRLLAVDRSRRRRGIGSALLRDAELRGIGVIAAEPGNYFTPGVSESLVPFFTARGYAETARTSNLEVDLIAAEGGGAALKAGENDRERVLEFIGREFGPVWRFEAMRGASIFYVEHQGQIAGFSTHEANNRGLGSFGPLGVAKSARGHRLGLQLLQASLADLRRLGYARAIIPWTDAIEYYRIGCGARVEQRFVILRRIAP
jgi:GNAT superfamily N-acetyltransferase